jgi:hypothetical protein
VTLESQALLGTWEEVVVGEWVKCMVWLSQSAGKGVRETGLDVTGLWGRLSAFAVLK